MHSLKPNVVNRRLVSGRLAATARSAAVRPPPLPVHGRMGIGSRKYLFRRPAPLLPVTSPCQSKLSGSRQELAVRASSGQDQSILEDDYLPQLPIHSRMLSQLKKYKLVIALFLVVAALAYPTAQAVAATSAASDGGSFLSTVVSFVLHLDKHLKQITIQYGGWTYAVLFAIVFAETGLVVTPFLPGDSLLFATGTLAAMGALNIAAVMGVFIVAAILGDTVNYAVGAWLGASVFTEDSKVFKKAYLRKTEQFYEKYGGKTVVLARFVPIVRTFAPFVAGVGSMHYATFVFYNVAGALLWTFLFTLTGFFFGQIPFVQNNFSVVVLAIVAISVLPILYEVYAARKEAAAKAASQPGAPYEKLDSAEDL